MDINHKEIAEVVKTLHPIYNKIMISTIPNKDAPIFVEGIVTEEDELQLFKVAISKKDLSVLQHETFNVPASLDIADAPYEWIKVVADLMIVDERNADIT